MVEDMGELGLEDDGFEDEGGFVEELREGLRLIDGGGGEEGLGLERPVTH